ncbi:MAG: MazG nucleotide pyrophosphohydrolase domain-containing protein [Dermatophilaceae bacterium]
MSAGRLRLLHTTPRVAPGLLTREAWQAVTEATQVVCRDLDDPLAAAVAEAGFAVQPADSVGEPTPESADPSEATAASTSADASAPALARRLVGSAASDDVVWLGSVDGDPGLADAIAAEVSRLETPPEVEVLLGSWDVPGARLLDVVAVMDRLRSAGGCPWDAEQTHESLAPYLVEEAHEVLAAISEGDAAHIAEELGDVLLQVVFHARVAEDAADGSFDVDTVAGLLVEKLVRRHPHVFADGAASTPDEVEQEWERIKLQERSVRESGASSDGVGAAGTDAGDAGAELLHGIPPTLPVESAAAKVLARARRRHLKPDDAALARLDAARAALAEAEAEARAALGAVACSARPVGAR